MSSSDTAIIAPPAPLQARRVWMVRLDRTAAAENEAMETGLLTFDAGVRGDLSDHLEFEQIYSEVLSANGGKSAKGLDKASRQLHLLLHEIQVGDLALSPLRAGASVAIGIFRGDHGTDGDNKPGRRVQWLRKDVPRSVFLDDLVFSMSAKQRVCEISRNDAARRIEAIAAGQPDPGVTGGFSALPDDPSHIESLLRQRFLSRMGVLFAGHALAGLVGEILKAMGYRVQVSPPGPDGGVDIRAGRGPLGMEDLLVAQVKSGDQVTGAEVLQQLEGAMHSSKANQALLVSWNGFTRAAAARQGGLWHEVRMWTAVDVMEAYIEHYDKLPIALRDMLPLRKAWIV